MNKTANPLSRPALGRGLDALLPPTRPASPAAAAAQEDAVATLPVGSIRPNPLQPRRHFAEAELNDLADSIRAQGVLQPILVRPVPGNGYEIVAGERRFRAAQRAGLAAIPALIRTINDERALEIAIVENLQRADLNPVEQARAFEELARRFQLSQEEVGKKTGKDRATIANALRLLRLDAAVLARLESGELTPGQARPLLALDPILQRQVAERIVAEAWSARRVEEFVSRAPKPARPAKPAPPRDPNLKDAEEQLARALGARVAIEAGKRNRGRITIAYNDLEEFQRLFELLCHTSN